MKQKKITATLFEMRWASTATFMLLFTQQHNKDNKI